MLFPQIGQAIDSLDQLTSDLATKTQLRAQADVALAAAQQARQKSADDETQATQLQRQAVEGLKQLIDRVYVG